MKEDSVVLAAVGDTATGREPPESIFDFVADTLRVADVRFAQVERLYSNRGSFQGQGIAPHVRQDPHMASAYQAVPFDVVSIGSNHTGDWGPEATEDTIAAFEQLGIPTVGAGRTIAEARKPAIVEKKGYRIAFLGYVSVLLPQYWATETRAGATPMRARTYYEPYEYQPGAPPKVVTIPHQKDLELLQEDVRKAKAESDFVFVSFHWGVHFTPKPLTDYQVTVGRATIDAGATAVLGHHPHVMQGVEIHNGGAIFYSLGNFSFFRRAGSPTFCLPNGEYAFDDVYTRQMEPDYTYRRTRFTSDGGIAFIQMDGSGIKQVEFVPTTMNEERQATVAQPGSPKFDEIGRYLVWASQELSGGIRQASRIDDRLLLYRRTDEQ